MNGLRVKWYLFSPGCSTYIGLLLLGCVAIRASARIYTNGRILEGERINKLRKQCWREQIAIAQL